MIPTPTISNDSLGNGGAAHTLPLVPSAAGSWKRALLPAYYAATWPLREWDGRRLAAQGRAPIVVVAYHRVADDRATRWTISNREFRQHITWLARHFDLVTLTEAQRRIAANENHRPTVSITFDDGYADNCREALPLLIRRQIPCTYFVTSQAVLEDRPFEHDLACGMAPRPNTPQQLRALIAAGVEIGAHTRTHADLGTVTDPAVLRDEIVGARDELQSALDCRIRYFAFPFGQHANLSPAAFALAKENGFDGVVSAYGGYNFPGDDPFHLQRACVDGPTSRLKIAVNLDPYKQWKIRRYEYR
ncbi:MAG: polysaccharide deacetylase family protein [Planctomycetia bacterium]|nr:polysaccharide deacetylase family protein [Planctomycetia bacterium]